MISGAAVGVAVATGVALAVASGDGLTDGDGDTRTLVAAKATVGLSMPKARIKKNSGDINFRMEVFG